jgi:hypothetical protein
MWHAWGRGEVFTGLTNSVDQSPSSEANNRSASQEIPYLSIEPKCSLPC